MGPPLQNAEGRPILCAFKLKQPWLKYPTLDQEQLREFWPDLASTPAGRSLTVLVSDGTGGELHELKAHCRPKTRRGEACKSFFLSGIGTLLKALGARAGDVLALVVQHDQELTVERNTPEAVAVADYNFGGGSNGGSPLSAKRRLPPPAPAAVVPVAAAPVGVTARSQQGSAAALAEHSSEERRTARKAAADVDAGMSMTQAAAHPALEPVAAASGQQRGRKRIRQSFTEQEQEPKVQPRQRQRREEPSSLPPQRQQQQPPHNQRRSRHQVQQAHELERPVAIHQHVLHEQERSVQQQELGQEGPSSAASPKQQQQQQQRRGKRQVREVQEGAAACRSGKEEYPRGQCKEHEVAPVPQQRQEQGLLQEQACPPRQPLRRRNVRQHPQQPQQVACAEEAVEVPCVQQQEAVQGQQPPLAEQRKEAQDVVPAPQPPSFIAGNSSAPALPLPEASELVAAAATARGAAQPQDCAQLQEREHAQQDQQLGLAAATEPLAEEVDWAGVDVDTSDDDYAAVIQAHKAHPHQRCRYGTSRRPSPRTAAAAALQAEEEAAAAAAAGKRVRRASQKARDRAEVAAEGGVQQRPAAPRTCRRGRPPGRNGGMSAMGGIGGAVASRGGGIAYQPMALLPGEQPLGVELFFGEARPLLPGGKLGPPHSDAGAGRDLQGAERYRAAVDRARQSLGQRMRGQGASEGDVADMLRLLQRFEDKCLAGQPTTPEESKQLCRDVYCRLRQVYNVPGQDPLVLDAHILSAAALKEQEGQADLQHMRTMERRFIIWTPTDVPAATAAAASGANHTSNKNGSVGGREPEGLAAPDASVAGEASEEEQAEAGAVPAAIAPGTAHDGAGNGGGWSLGTSTVRGLLREVQRMMSHSARAGSRDGEAGQQSSATAIAAAAVGAAERMGAVAVGQEGLPAMRAGQAEEMMEAAAAAACMESPSLGQEAEMDVAAEGEVEGQQAALVAAGSSAGGAWDRGLAGIWREFTRRAEGQRYGDIALHSTDLPVSCALNDTEWQQGQLKRNGVKQNANVLKQIELCRQGKRAGRLYITDGSMPDYQQQQHYPADAPGMPCGVDDRANAMLPHAVRSSRATNLFHAVKSESTGTKTFSLFGPAGGGTNLTAFHLETKRRRSYNCGTGDFIIQPPATLAAIRKLMRVHAAVAGRHSRHGQLLPLEVYLEEGVPLVMHVRDYPYATLCELCEQSMHAFISFGTVACSPPALKVSCNDFDLLWELGSCYWMEKVACLYSHLNVFPEEALPPDKADTWVMSAFLLRRPNTLAEKQAGWEAPWLCEAQGTRNGGQGLGEGQGVGAVDDSEMDWGVDVIAVRCCEKMLDVLAGKLRQAASWAGEVPNEGEAVQALRAARPVLLDMHRRAVSEGEGGRFVRGVQFQPRRPLECHFSLEYMGDLLAAVDAALHPHIPAAQQTGQVEGQQQAGQDVATALAGTEASQLDAVQPQQEALQSRPLSAAAAGATEAAGAFELVGGAAAAAGGSCGVAACLLTGEAHAAYAAASSQEERYQLAQQADAMLAACSTTSSTGTAMGAVGGPASPGAVASVYASGGALSSCVPALCDVAPAVLRSHWMLRVQLEWEAALAQPLDLAWLAKRRRQRSEVEALMDCACQQLARLHQADWGVRG